MDVEKIGEFISKRRKECNLTQEALANKIYVTNKAVSRWENGKSLPEIETLYLLSKELNTSVNEILEAGIEKEDEIKEYYEQTRIYNKKTIIDIVIFGIIIFITMFSFVSIAVVSLGIFNASLVDLGVEHEIIKNAHKITNNEMLKTIIPFAIGYLLIFMGYMCYKLKNKKLFYFTCIFTILVAILIFKLSFVH